MPGGETPFSGCVVRREEEKLGSSCRRHEAPDSARLVLNKQQPCLPCWVAALPRVPHRSRGGRTSV